MNDEQQLPENFEIISSQEIGSYGMKLIEVRHKFSRDRFIILTDEITGRCCFMSPLKAY